MRGPDEAYRSLCDSPRLRHLIAGYIDSAYSGRPLTAVVAEAAAYRRLYGISSVFVDQVTSGLQGVRYYRELGEELRKRGTCRLILNPGVVPKPSTTTSPTSIVTFEGPWTALPQPHAADPGRAGAAGAPPGISCTAHPSSTTSYRCGWRRRVVRATRTSPNGRCRIRGTSCRRVGGWRAG